MNFTIDIPKPSCLDSAYERLAIDQGMNTTPVFPENEIYYQQKIDGKIKTGLALGYPGYARKKRGR